MSVTATLGQTEKFPRVEAVRDFLQAQDFTPVQDRAELKRLLSNAVDVNATEGFKQDAETDALDALFIELGVPLGAVMDAATDLYLESKIGRYYG